MPTHQSLSEIAAEIARRTVPALFVDTCAALDVVRCGARGKPKVAAIVQHVIGAQSANELLLFGPSVLLAEAARNRMEVEGGARKSAMQIDEAVDVYRQIAGTVGTAYPHTTPFGHESVVVSLVNLHDQLLAACVHATADPSLASTVLKRAGDRRRPARGGGGANDCLLFEEFRSVAREVPSADPLILLTTNTDDFGDKSTVGAVHGEIADDLLGTKARVCLSWGEAAAAVLSSARLKRI